MTTCGFEGGKGAGGSELRSPSAPLAPPLTLNYGASDIDHRLTSILARPLQDAIRLLLRRSGAAHQNPLCPLNDLAILQLTARRDRVLPRLDQVAGATGGKSNRGVDDARRRRLGEERDRRGRDRVTVAQRERRVARQ